MSESLTVVYIENTRTKKEFYKGRNEEAPEYHGSNRREHFFPCISRPENQWKEAENRWECGHRYRNDALEGSSENRIFIEWESFFETEMLIMIYEHDTISRYYPHQSDESYEVSGRHDPPSEPDSDHPSEPSRDNPEKYLKHEDNTPKMPIENCKKCQKNPDRNQSEKSWRFFLSRVESLIGYSIFFRNSESADFGFYIIYNWYYGAILSISRDDYTTLRILMIDDIASFREGYIGDISDKYTPLRREWKWDTSNCFYSIGPVSWKLENYRIGVLSVDHSGNFFSSDSHIKYRLHFGIADILRDESRSIGTDIDTRNFCLRFEAHIQCSFDGIGHFEYFFSDALELIEIRPKNLYHQWSTDSWDNLLDSMSDRLTDTDDSDFLVLSDNRIDFLVYPVLILIGYIF